MAFFRTILATTLVILLAVYIAEAEIGSKSDTGIVGTPTAPAAGTPAPAASPYLDIAACGGECARRCKLSSRPNLCQRACGSCCRTCRCVPSGTAGNYEECLCYAKLTTHGNKRKCP